MLLSSLKANAVAPGKEEVLDAEIGLEHQDLMKKFMKVGASEIIGKLSGYTDNLYDVDGVTLLEPIEFADTTITMRVNVPTTFRKTVVLSLDKAIEEALENYGVYRINEFKGHSFEIFQINYEKAISKILTYISARTQTITRSYKLL
jgi:hypothetical protein